jgi:D-serine deaminase-like pyridoxal phosphate-dependent protein
MPAAALADSDRPDADPATLVGAPLAALETPCLLLEAERLERNCARLRARLSAHGVSLRQHVKTAKSEPVARLAAGGGTGPITVSTLKEADRFAAAGWRDILYAVGMVPNKLAHAMRLRARGVDLKVVLDSVEAAHALREALEAGSARDERAEAAAVGGGARLPVLIEIDCDGHRAGVRPSDADRLLAIGRALESEATSLAGVMTHAGGSYDCRTPEAIAEIAERERASIVQAAGTLVAAGLPCAIRSVGSTPTALAARRLDGVTEVRAGVYQFFDLVMAGLGVCSLDDIAMSVLASVIGHQRERGWTLVDAGWMAMSRDRGTAAQPVDQGYGWPAAPTARRSTGS